MHYSIARFRVKDKNPDFFKMDTKKKGVPNFNSMYRNLAEYKRVKVLIK